MVKNLPAMQETQVQFLGQEDVLEKGKAIHSSIPGELHEQRSLAVCSPWRHKESGMTERLTHTHSTINEKPVIDLKAQGCLSNEEIPYEHSLFHGHSSVFHVI